MKHLGDITKISGYDIPIVDVITGGSPCQDLSVAGNRAGLEGERSGLFMEQIRIVKEMRERDRRDNKRTGFMVRPRYMVWENVPGAFSSNHGKDFQAVLTEIVKIADEKATDVPMPEKGKWGKSGCLYDEMGRWSVAWRVHDAQFWGVPQRRKRIALVADFGGLSAPEILFERKGLSRDIESCSKEGEGTSETVGECAESASYTLKVRGGVERDSYGKKAGKGALVQTEKSGTLGVSQDQTLIQTKEPILLESNQDHATVQTDGVSTALPASMGEGGGYVPMVTDDVVCIGNGQENEAARPERVSKPLNCLSDTMKVMCIGNGQTSQLKMSDKVGTLNCMHDQQAVIYDAYQHHGWRKSDLCNPLTAGQNQSIRGDTPLVVGDKSKDVDAQSDNRNDPED